jgi:hypothetical protein
MPMGARGTEKKVFLFCGGEPFFVGEAPFCGASPFLWGRPKRNKRTNRTNKQTNKQTKKQKTKHFFSFLKRRTPYVIRMKDSVALLLRQETEEWQRG